VNELLILPFSFSSTKLTLLHRVRSKHTQVAGICSC